MANKGDAKPEPGNRVIFIELPPGFLNDLPQADQQAIEAVVGQPIRLNEYDADGRAELEFRDRNGCLHKVYVGPEFIRVMNQSERDKFESGMQEISNVFDHYRLSARTIWNTAFWPDPDFRNWDSIDQFHEIEKLLFREFVLAKVDRDWPLCDLFVNAIPFFQIAPSHTHGTSIMIQKPRPEATTGYWVSSESNINNHRYCLRRWSLIHNGRGDTIPFGLPLSMTRSAAKLSKEKAPTQICQPFRF